MWRRTAPAERNAPASQPPSLPAALARASFTAVVLALPLTAWLLRAHGWPMLGNVLSIVLVAAALAACARALGVRAALVPLAAALALAAAAAGAGLAPVYWPPVAINLAMAATFAVSLVGGDPLIVRFARLEGTPLTPSIVRYCRRLTLVWALYLALLGAIGMAIALHGDERIGAWWSGALNYVLIAALFVAERFVRPQGARVSVAEQARNALAVLRRRRA
jgi:uncharacterized membrane protein